jgi:hypothetical protein
VKTVDYSFLVYYKETCLRGRAEERGLGSCLTIKVLVVGEESVESFLMLKVFVRLVGSGLVTMGR